jgi:hypothetical protein
MGGLGGQGVEPLGRSEPLLSRSFHPESPREIRPHIDPNEKVRQHLCSDSCFIQEPLDVTGGSIYDNAVVPRARC